MTEQAKQEAASRRLEHDTANPLKRKYPLEYNPKKPMAFYFSILLPAQSYVLLIKNKTCTRQVLFLIEWVQKQGYSPQYCSL